MTLGVASSLAASSAICLPPSLMACTRLPLQVALRLCPSVTITGRCCAEKDVLSTACASYYLHTSTLLRRLLSQYCLLLVSYKTLQIDSDAAHRFDRPGRRSPARIRGASTCRCSLARYSAWPVMSRVTSMVALTLGERARGACPEKEMTLYRPFAGSRLLVAHHVGRIDVAALVERVCFSISGVISNLASCLSHDALVRTDLGSGT